MTKREYFEKVDQIVRDTIAKLNLAKSEIDAADKKIGSGKFSREGVQEIKIEREKMEKSIATAKETALAEIKKLSDGFCKEITEKNKLKASDITDDAKLMNIGVKLSPADLEEMFDRNSGNATMERLIHEYARQNDVKISRVPRFNGEMDFKSASDMPTACNYILKNHSVPSMYHQFMGDGSNYRNQFMSDAES